MKKTLLFAVTLFIGSISFAQVGINTENPDASSALDVTATDKGLLPPRMTEAQRTAISNPAEGLIVYNTDISCIELWNGTGWVSLCDGSVSLTPQSCDNDVSVGTGAIVQMMYDYNGDGTAEYSWCAREVTAAANGGTGTWLDRNLGAYRVATTTSDQQGRGDLYQWGRDMDGHQKRVQRSGQAAEEGAAIAGIMVNDEVAGPVMTDPPMDVKFITVNSNPNDWLADNNNDRWNLNPQANNPCPTNYSVPTEADFDALIMDLDIDNDTNMDSTEAINSPLALPVSGFRNRTNGSVLNAASVGFYWTSDVDGSNSPYLFFNSSSSLFVPLQRANGLAVRCLKD